jgi:2-polyprenyl-6-methoxyphenol hydroxylase-like FAD-dependent oxidoreductase
MAAPSQSDALIIGGGHNGLVCAAYLAAGGLEVTVLERRGVVGGAAVTEEFHPGFRNSVAAYTVSLLNPKVISDLDLPKHGLRVVERLVSNFLPTEDGRYLKTGGAHTHPEVANSPERRCGQLAISPTRAVECGPPGWAPAQAQHENAARASRSVRNFRGRLSRRLV